MRATWGGCRVFRFISICMHMMGMTFSECIQNHETNEHRFSTSLLVAGAERV